MPHINTSLLTDRRFQVDYVTDSDYETSAENKETDTNNSENLRVRFNRVDAGFFMAVDYVIK